ncbi:MAG: carboxylate--amine ligase [Rhodospirillaceae bacterium]|nr:carboxylate--amine ligase [Rhodospirillaceae bacterium]
MTAPDLLAQAQAAGRQALSEFEAKRLLSGYDIPFAAEREAADPAAACAAARKIGFPVAVKGCGEAFTHKTELALVALDLAGTDAVARAAEAILGRMQGRGSLLVQAMVPGRREFLLGMHRDPQYGPLVTFGLGGVFAEAIDDVAMRLAPLGERDAHAMLAETRAGALLDDVRGMARVDRPALVAAILGMSRLGVERAEVAAVDVNPLIATDDGKIIGVDALVLLAQP